MRVSTLTSLLNHFTSGRTSLLVLISAILVGAYAISISARGSAQEPPQGDDLEQKRAKLATTPTDLSKAIYKDPSQAPTPLPDPSRFENNAGFFVIDEYDSRRISDSERAADPLQDPAWPPFVRCMQSRGLGTGISNPDRTTQADINRLVEEVNKTGPFFERTPRGSEYRPKPASVAFVECERVLHFESRTPLMEPPRVPR